MAQEEVEILNHHESLNQKKVKLIGFLSFLMGFSQSLLIYVLSGYFEKISGTENVGLFYLLAYAAGLWFLFDLHRFIGKFGRSGVFNLSVFLKILFVTLAMLSPEGYWTIVFLMAYLVFGVVEWVSLDVILESFSVDNMSGRIRGKHLTFMNAGFILGPFLSAIIVEKLGFPGIFLLLFILNSATLVVSLLGLGRINHEIRKNIGIKEIFEKIRQRKNISRIYHISFALEFFYALMVIYTPIYLRDLGMSFSEVGVVLSIMLIPFVLVQYPAGFIADKKLGEKEMIIMSLSVMAVSTMFIYFIESASVFLWALTLTITRFGAAMLEVLRDSYFYKRIDASDVDLNDFFRTAMPVGYILSTLISFVALFVFPVKTMFALIALVVASAIPSAIFLSDNKCEKEISLENVRG